MFDEVMYEVKSIWCSVFVQMISDKLRKGGKRDGTPEKPTTPNTDNLDEDELAGKKQIIVNDEILAMQIKHEDLQKVGIKSWPCRSNMWNSRR